jgi:hypothetical protein
VEVSAPVELESGEVVTVMAPITINVELRVSVDGKGEAKVIEDAIQEPTIAVTESVVPKPTDAVEIRNFYSTSGIFVRLLFGVENLGNEPISLREVEGRLVDERQRQFAEMDYRVAFDEICEYAQVNPGLTVSCVMVFDVPKNVESLTLHLMADDETVEVPLTIVD